MNAVLGDRRIRLVIGCGCGIALLAFGVRSGFGLFLEPISSARGWSREIFAFAIAIQHLLWGIGQPIAGAIADRFGPIRVLITGALLYGGGIALMAFSSDPLSLYLSAGVMVGLGLSGASFTIVLSAIGKLVAPETRSVAFGLGTAAGSLGQFLMVPLGQSILTQFGWENALLCLAVAAMLIAPLAFGLRSRATDQVASTGQAQSLRQALQQAAHHASYWYLTAGFFVCGFHVAFIQTHLPAYLRDLGLAPKLGAWALALVGLFNIFGAFGSGVLGARLSKRKLLSGLYLARAIVIAVFVSLPITPVSVLVFSSALGLLWLSTVPLTSGLVALMFGPRYMGTLFGIVFLSHQIGAFLGAWMGAWWYERTGSYDLAWWFSVTLGLLATALHWPIEERPADAITAVA